MPFFKTYFTDTQVILLIISSVSFFLSIFAQAGNKKILTYVFLGITAASLFSFTALLDPFLNFWDERFHALVAKNLTKHPLMPTLYDEVLLDYPYPSWTRSHIWLHKQPLFLWLIALSFKLFGFTEFALRLPSVILATITVLITYRTAKLLVNERVGFVASVLLMSTIYFLELITGRQELDQNDMIFISFVSLSLWSFVEYYYSKKKIWILMIGAFSGMAVLCKWLVGLLVYFTWGFFRIIQKRIKIKQNLDFLVSLGVTLLVAVPWQIFIFVKYHAEALLEYKYSSKHFSVPLEGHSGDFWFHFDEFNGIYGTFASFLIIPAFLILMKYIKQDKLKYSLLATVIFVYLFFSIAATKMPSFTIIVSMLIFIALAALFVYIADFITKFIKNKNLKHLIFFVPLIVLFFYRLDIEDIQKNHTLWQGNWLVKMLGHNKQVFQSLDLPENTVLFNIRGEHYVEAMFYTEHTAYEFIPSQQQYQLLKDKNRTIAIFKSENMQIPDYLKNDTTVIFLQDEIWSYY